MIACPRCGAPNPDDAYACGNCGLSRYPAAPPPGTGRPDAVVASLLPVGRSGLSIAAGYVGLFALVIVILGPVSLLLGVFALRDLSRHPEKLGKGRAIFAIVAGVWGTVATVLIWLANG